MFPSAMNSGISQSALTDRTTHCSETSPGLSHDLKSVMNCIVKPFYESTAFNPM